MILSFQRSVLSNSQDCISFKYRELKVLFIVKRYLAIYSCLMFICGCHDASITQFIWLLSLGKKKRKTKPKGTIWFFPLFQISLPDFYQQLWFFKGFPKPAENTSQFSLFFFITCMQHIYKIIICSRNYKFKKSKICVVYLVLVAWLKFTRYLLIKIMVLSSEVLIFCENH